MNGRNFLTAARRLAVGPDEADWRSAASRAYYAAFHVGRELLASLRFRVPRADRAHEYLYRRLNNSGLLVAEDAARLLHDLRSLRNRADSDMHIPFAVSVSGDCVVDAGQVIQTLDTLLPAERSQMTDAMKLYEQGIGDVTWQP